MNPDGPSWKGFDDYIVYVVYRCVYGGVQRHHLQIQETLPVKWGFEKRQKHIITYISKWNARGACNFCSDSTAVRHRKLIRNLVDEWPSF